MLRGVGFTVESVEEQHDGEDRLWVVAVKSAGNEQNMEVKT